MPDFVFPPSDPVSLPVVGMKARFPVRRIFCIGKNYAEHIREMGGDVAKSEPVIFTKAPSAIVESGAVLPYPKHTQNLHFEVELVAAVGPDGVFGYGVGIDLTRRDLQSEAKSRREPWARAKDFMNSAPCSAITPASDTDLENAHIVLRKNGDIVQHAKLASMIWSVDAIMEMIAGDMGLQPGDLIFTGTPEGVGPVIAGDELEGGVQGLAPIRVRFC